MKKKRRREILSILLVPDDDTDPLSFRISYRLVKILGIIAFIVMIHFLTGIVFYWKFAVVSSRNALLNKENTELKIDNDKIAAMTKTVDELIEYQNRVKAVFGINQSFEVSDRRRIEVLNNETTSTEVPSPNISNMTTEKKRIEGKSDFLFLTQAKSSYHDLAENLPTYLPVEGFLTTDFQDSEWFFPHRHLGLDIAARQGTPVCAAADGIVLFANWTNELGNLIIIHHLNEFITLYGHNQVLLKKELSTVKKGEIIALLGNSGQSTAPHLHFEIRKNGVPVDPKEYLISFQTR